MQITDIALQLSVVDGGITFVRLQRFGRIVFLPLETGVHLVLADVSLGSHNRARARYATRLQRGQFQGGSSKESPADSLIAAFFRPDIIIHGVGRVRREACQGQCVACAVVRETGLRHMGITCGIVSSDRNAGGSYILRSNTWGQRCSLHRNSIVISISRCTVFYERINRITSIGGEPGKHNLAVCTIVFLMIEGKSCFTY